MAKKKVSGAWVVKYEGRERSFKTYDKASKFAGDLAAARISHCVYPSRRKK